MDGVLLFEDETILRLFPVLRRAWSLRGYQARVPITGRNDKRVLFGTINIRTGHRLVHPYLDMRQESFQDFLRLLRRNYKGRPIWLLLDDAPCHTAPKSIALAQLLNIELISLPKQCPELNAMDHLWKQVKAEISANYQFKDIDQHAHYAQQHVLYLTTFEAKLRAGILSENFWLKLFV